MSRNEKKGHGGKHTRPQKWSGACRPAGLATTALGLVPLKFASRYLDGDSNFKIEAINHQTFDRASK